MIWFCIVLCRAALLHYWGASHQMQGGFCPAFFYPVGYEVELLVLMPVVDFEFRNLRRVVIQSSIFRNLRHWPNTELRKER